MTLLCAIVAMLDGFDTQSIAYVAPRIAEDWGLKPSEFGPIFAAGLFGLMAGAFLLSPAADRWGRKKIILLSTFIFGLFALLTAWATSMNELLAYRFITGVGLGAAMPNIIALTSEYAPQRLRATLVTVMFCGFPLGSTLGGLISGGSSRISTGTRCSCWAACCPCCCCRCWPRCCPNRCATWPPAAPRPRATSPSSRAPTRAKTRPR